MSSISDYISEADEKAIIEAIKAGEKRTSGEIRLHIEMHCPLKDPYERALQVFEQLEMHNTDLSNGILIYLALEDHKLVVCGDKGINDIVGEGYWKSTVDHMISYFKKDSYKEGLIQGVTMVSQKLKEHFPYEKGDTNELSDDISKG
jgi:uncharacterized membrane protein